MSDAENRTDNDALARAIEAAFTFDTRKKPGDRCNVVEALFAIAATLESVATQLKYLNNGNAAASLELVGAHLGEKLDRIAAAQVRSLGNGRDDH